MERNKKIILQYLTKSILAGALFVLCIISNAQDTLITIPDTIADSKEELIILSDPKTEIESVTEIEDTTKKKRYHSPRKAIVFSAVIPGLGQAYNKKYWKIPILFAAGAALVYVIDYNNDGYYEFKNYLDQLNAGIVLPPNYQYNNVRLNMDSFRRWRDFDIILLSGLYFLNIIDAMVDAYFYEYDISDDLTLKIEPSLLNTGQYHASTGFKVSLRF